MPSRDFPLEVHIGQKVLVRPSPTEYAIPALITFIDAQNGVIHVNPIGYKVRWQAKPRAVTTPQGLFLHFANNNFFYSEQPYIA